MSYYGDAAPRAGGAGNIAISEFAQALLGRSIPEQDSEVDGDRVLLEWLATISDVHERKLLALSCVEFERQQADEHQQWLSDVTTAQEEWDPAKHPRRGGPPNAGWFESTGSYGGTSSGRKSPSLLAGVIRRNQEIGELSGVITPEMIRSSRLATELQSAAQLPAEVAAAVAAGLGTGGKAVVNGFATAVKDVSTLGLSPGQLELIGVTREDRDRGYDTAVSITTASGQVLIAVGTGGAASALSKGGTIARTASGTLVAYDAAGNAVGVVQGVYDASQNGLNLGNGVKVAGSLLGLKANAKTAGDLHHAATARRVAEVDAYVAKLPRKVTPSTTAANQYEIKHTGRYNYTVSGGGAKLDVDGYRGKELLDAKHVGSESSSPYIPGSSCPDIVRRKILAKARSEFRRARKILTSGATPFKSLEIITNASEAKDLFEKMLKESRVPGRVRLEQ